MSFNVKLAWSSIWILLIITNLACDKLKWKLCKVRSFIGSYIFCMNRHILAIHQASKFWRFSIMVWMQNFGFNHKLVIIVWCPLSTKRQGTLHHKGGELVGENFMVGQIFEELDEEEGEAYTMDERRHSKPFSPNWKLWCVMDSKHNKCAPIIRWT